MKLPELLRTAREAKGYSQVDVAKKLKSSTGAVGGWESGKHGISKAMLPKVSKLLDIPYADLLVANALVKAAA